LALRTTTKPNIFILKDKEEASYFINDLENILERKVLFFPESYRRTYQFSETDNSNILLRAEVLNKLNSNKKPIIITYPEALSEKVISRNELRKQTIKLQISQTCDIENLIEELEKMNFKQSDFVTDPGQFSIRGGIVDVFSFANEYPYRIEFNEDELESIRTFDINSQLSIENHKKVIIIPNTEAKKTNSKKTSFINYLPSNSQLWIKDIAFISGKIDDVFRKSQNESQRNNKNIKLDFKIYFLVDQILLMK
jgi:transcription-repair coupling factor (superfamily II helicase)